MDLEIFKDGPRMIEWLQQWGTWAIGISLLLSVFISVVGVIPSIILSGANVAVFGLIQGFFISWTGEVIGAAITFWLYRKGLILITRKQSLEWQWTNRLRAMSRKKQFLALLLARITPVVPSGIVTFAAVASSVPFLIYFIASIVGKIPSVAMETLVVHDLFLWEDNKLRYVTSVILLAILLLFYRKPKSHQQK